VKKGNRDCERLLKAIDAAAVLALLTGALHPHDYPHAQLEGLWKLVLQNQFHDVLPGTSIALVYEDTTRHHQQVLKEVRHATPRYIMDGGGTGHVE
jgi:alpha-mannosidase